MKRNVIILGAAGAALALTVSACSSKKAASTTATSSTPAASASAPGASTPAAGGATVASKLILGGPPEFQTRVDGIPGLAKNYGVTFGSYKVLDLSLIHISEPT